MKEFKIGDLVIPRAYPDKATWDNPGPVPMNEVDIKLKLVGEICIVTKTLESGHPWIRLHYLRLDIPNRETQWLNEYLDHHPPEITVPQPDDHPLGWRLKKW